MKMFKESFRRLLPIGLPLLVITMIYTVITQGQNCFGEFTIQNAQKASSLNPVLIYYAFTAILFAMYGFSFLFRRSSSDLYHSFPVSRLDLYLSVTLATALWMGGTIAVNVLTGFAMLLVGGCPFVPVFIPLTILFYFVASMLVFAAAAIGCALSGTLLTALASTGIVLLLPRFIQFVISRGIVTAVPIVGWHDLGALLLPETNIATGLIVMQTRPFLSNVLFRFPNVFYSMLPMVLELALGAWLFLRRPSETADRGTGHKAWSVAVAAFLSLVALLLITVDGHRLLSLYGATMTAIALLVFVIYQFVALRSVKQVLLSLPCFLLSAALAFGVSATIGGLSSQMLNTTPTADEIESVTFRGHDIYMTQPDYSSLLITDIRFTDDGVKKAVASALSDAVDEIREPDLYGYNTYNPYQTIEPITLRLKDGRTVDRSIEFRDVNALNELRFTNTEFKAALLAYPVPGNVQYQRTDSNDCTPEEGAAIWQSYANEAQSLGLVTDDYYRAANLPLDSQGNSVASDTEQSVATIYYTGYLGDRLFSCSRNIRLDMPKTASLTMRTYNAHMRKDTIPAMKSAIKHMSSSLMLENDSFNLSLTCFNAPWNTSHTRSVNLSIYVSGYSKENDIYLDSYIQFANRIEALLERATLTDDPSGIFVSLSLFEYDSTNRESINYPQGYYRFSAEDEQQLLTLLSDWNTIFNYTYDE